MEWYPQNKEELNSLLDELIKDKADKDIHGLLVPHAGYEFSGKIAGKAFGFLRKRKTDKAIVLGPSHYSGFEGIRVLEKSETPLGKINILKHDFETIGYEHSVDNQIPFLQKLGFKEILPLVVGEINNEGIKEIVKKILEIDAVYIFSTDLSHFLPYEEAVKKDKESIKIIENLDTDNFKNIDACGISPLLIMMHLCKSKGWKPHLIEYKNSGDIIEDKSKVVGYASFSF